jgi:hypothetical protein
MKNIAILVAFLVIGTAVTHASGVGQADIDAEYAEKTWADKSDWTYEFNQVASKVAEYKNTTVEHNGDYLWSVQNFDENSYRYKVLLDRGVAVGFIDDKIRQQQLAKLRKERDVVSKILARSSGLGL